jgi:ubiquinone/menaquinone biosynthesis C-methylase UbiE
MSFTEAILLRMFGRPQGMLGRLGGIIMARTNEACGAWVTQLLEIAPRDTVLEVGFGPLVIIERLSKLAAAPRVAGIDASQEMVEQARARNRAAIRTGQVDLRRGSVESLPFDSNAFDKALAINSMQVWRDIGAGLREVRRVMKPAAKLALGFTAYAGQPKTELTGTLAALGFLTPALVERDTWFCVLASKPDNAEPSATTASF